MNRPILGQTPLFHSGYTILGLNVEFLLLKTFSTIGTGYQPTTKKLEAMTSFSFIAVGITVNILPKRQKQFLTS
jgi:hypothetical protein